MKPLLIGGLVFLTLAQTALGYAHCHSKPKCQDGSNPACSCLLDGVEVGCGKRSGCKREDSVYECFDGGPINYGDFQEKYKCPQGLDMTCTCQSDDTKECNQCPSWEWEVSCSDGSAATRKGWKDYATEKPKCSDGSTPACSCEVAGKEVGCGWKNGCKREDTKYDCGELGPVMYGDVEKKYKCPIEEAIECECISDMTKECAYCPMRDWDVSCSGGSTPEDNNETEVEYRKSKGKMFCEGDGSRPKCTCGEGGLDCHEARCDKDDHFHSCPEGSGPLNYGNPSQKYECPKEEELSCICSDNNPSTCSYCPPLDWILTCSNGSEATKVDWKRKHGGHHSQVKPKCEGGSTPACSCKVDGEEVGCGHHSGCDRKDAVFSCLGGGAVDYGDFNDKYECEDDAELGCKCGNDDTLPCNNCHPKDWDVTCSNGNKAEKIETNNRERHHHHGRNKPKCDDGRSPACSCKLEGKEVGCGHHSGCQLEDKMYSCGEDVLVNFGDFRKKYECPSEEEVMCECETDEDLDCSRCPTWDWDVSCSEGSDPEEKKEDKSWWYRR